jgi:predicted peroxiredoxin
MFSKLKSLILSSLIVLSVLVTPAIADNGNLFINLTSDEMNRAAMAIGFGHKILTKKKIPVTIFLNVEGVRLADRNIPQHTHVSGKTNQQMLSEFMKDGGTVIVCPMCLKNVGGMTSDDLIEGVKVGGPDVTWPALFADDTTVLSY